MKLNRKQVVFGAVAGLFAWIGSKRAAAAVPELVPIPVPPNPTIAHLAGAIVQLQREVAALQAQLATQVAFTKDANGNLSLDAGAGNVTLNVPQGNLTLGVAQGNLQVAAAAGAIQLQAAQALTLQGADLTMKALNVASLSGTAASISANATASITAPQTGLTGSAQCVIKGGLVTIN